MANEGKSKVPSRKELVKSVLLNQHDRCRHDIRTINVTNSEAD